MKTSSVNVSVLINYLFESADVEAVQALHAIRVQRGVFRHHFTLHAAIQTNLASQRVLIDKSSQLITGSRGDVVAERSAPWCLLSSPPELVKRGERVAPVSELD